jgi:hypothetical protein
MNPLIIGAALLAAGLGVMLAIGGPSLAPWRRLAGAYPDQSFSAETTYRSVHCYVSGAVFGVAARWARIELGPIGIRLSVPPPLRRFFPAIVLPWSEIVDCSRKHFFPLAPFLRITVARHAGSISLIPTLWRNEPLTDTILNAWHERHTQAA